MSNQVVEKMLSALDDFKKEIIEKLAKKYGFDTKEALTYLENEKEEPKEPKEKITIENVHNHITYDYEIYEHDDGKDQAELKVMWDHENEEIDELLDSDFRGDLDCMGRKNLMYIEEVKKRANWVKGEKITIQHKQNCDGCVYLYWNVDKTDDYLPSGNVLGMLLEGSLVIEPEGYVLVRHFNHYVRDCSKFYIRVNSVYNDSVYDELSRKEEEVCDLCKCLVCSCLTDKLEELTDELEGHRLAIIGKANKDMLLSDEQFERVEKGIEKIKELLRRQ